MRITIVGSIKFYEKYKEIKKELEEKGHEVILPLPYESYDQEITKKDTMNEFNDNLEKSDIILVANFDKEGQPNYIGVNSLMEMGIAFNKHKKIFILNDIPENCKEELEAIEVIALNGNLEDLKNA